MTSWRTTVGGLCAGVGGAIIGAKATGVVGVVPVWLMWIGIILAAAGPVLLGTVARDNNKSSEDVGVKLRGRTPMIMGMIGATLLLSGCFMGSGNVETGEFAVTRVGDQELTGVTFIRKADGSVEFTLEKQRSEGQVATEVLLKALDKIP